ncbi:MAG: protein translocase subunit SecD [Parcubacteria group bacterium]|nr:protein translocase subunit SecD [Parcubacteria group bacterium]
MKPRIIIPLIVVLTMVAGFFVYPAFLQKGNITPQFFIKPFRLGLDLLGGTHLVYEANLDQISAADRASAMEGLRDVIERRVNIFGVSEPVVAVNQAGQKWRLVVELAGVKNINDAIRMIGQTPYLEFREQRPEEETKQILESLGGQDYDPRAIDPYFTPTQLSGRYLKKAILSFDSQTSRPEVSLEFDDVGRDLFGQITKQNVNKPLAIYLDGLPISAPVVQQEITSGRAQITGNFGVKEAKQLVERLNSGALPVPISLISQQSVGASLGQDSLRRSLAAGAAGFILVVVFMLVWYRLSGLVAVLALIIYTILTLAVFKLIPVTLTLAGVAGFILSIGMAVDANILIFERMKEELRSGRVFGSALEEGFKRAWNSIRDSNVSSLITASILYWFGSSLVRGFALTLGLGILISMFSAITLTRTFLRVLAGTRLTEVKVLWKR